MSEPREPGDPPICPYCGEVMRGRYRCPCRAAQIAGVPALLASVGVSVYEPTAADLDLPSEALAARIRERAVIERNNRASVHYWERATHLLRRGEFETCH